MEVDAGKSLPGASKGLADEPFKPVALEGISIAAGGADAEPWLVRGERVQTEESADEAFAPFGDPFKLAPREEPGGFWEDQAASFFLPWRRRRLITFLPPAVFMRARKPMVFLRRSLLGWYVRFINFHPNNKRLLEKIEDVRINTQEKI